MKAWTSEELTKIGNAEELDISSIRSKGKLSTPVTIWVVRVADDIYVRSVNGRDGLWFRGTQVTHNGHISSGGVEKDVTFVDADPAVNDQVDAAFQAKYKHYSKSIVGTEFTPQARASTTRLVPR
jgi:hypothetical protein